MREETDPKTADGPEPSAAVDADARSAEKQHEQIIEETYGAGSRPHAPSVTLTLPGQDERIALQGNLRASPADVQSPVELFPQIPRSPSLSVSSAVGTIPFDEKQGQMQHCWEQSIRKHLEAPDGYDRVGVLIIKWRDDLDDMNTREECEELEQVFRDQYNYETKILELDNVRHPQNELAYAVTGQVREYGLPSQRNLLIIYYSGHGRFNEDKNLLYFTPAKHDISPTSTAPFPAVACWNQVETNLLDAWGDIVTIFDTCLASNLMTGKQVEPYLDASVMAHVGDGEWSNWHRNGIYQHISASGIDRDTPRPGEGSFTSDLISLLRELQPKGSFSTSYLTQRLWKMREHRRIPLAWDRFGLDSGHIRLGPVVPKVEPSPRTPAGKMSDISQLGLDFELEQTGLTETEIEDFCREVAHACRKAPFKVRDVHWRGIRRRGEPRQQFLDVAEAVRRTSNVMRRLSRPPSRGEYSPTGLQPRRFSDVDMNPSRAMAPKRKASDSHSDTVRQPANAHFRRHSPSKSVEETGGKGSAQYLQP